MRTYIVVGMHRSATSFLARALVEQGVNMGKRLLGPGPGNPEGHFENIDFLLLNKKILRAAGGDWRHPPPKEKILLAGKELESEIKATIEKNRGEMWGWKDPRTSLTLDLYLPFLEDDVYIFACFRKPTMVAKSLKRRDGMPIGEGRKLAGIYNDRLIESIRRFLNSVAEKSPCESWGDERRLP